MPITITALYGFTEANLQKEYLENDLQKKRTEMQ